MSPLFVGGARLATMQGSMSTGVYERTIGRQYHNDHFHDGPVAPTMGNMFEPMPEYAAVSGGWLACRNELAARSLSRAALASVAAAAAGPAGLWWLRSRHA